MSEVAFTDSVVATPDPPPRGVPNPIHDADGADAAGYAGALVAGVRTYGWACEVLVRALGREWAQTGWVDYTLRRPLYAGERLDIEARSDQDHWRLECTVGAGDERRVVMDGSAGHGAAPFAAELDPPLVHAPQPASEVLPGYDLATVPLRTPLNPLAAYVSNQAAFEMVDDDLQVADSAFARVDEVNKSLPPYFLAGRMAPLTRHNFSYGPTIHVRSQIQHQRLGTAESMVTIGAQIVEAYERNEHWYQVLDGVITDDLGPLALLRHTTIFRPRGT
ncbi:MAG: hypothetical protein AAF513_08325 [Pseudomonadota bacterium]